MMDNVTILMVKRPLIATKRIRFHPDRPPEIIEYDNAKFFSAVERNVGGLDDLAKLLWKIEAVPRAMVVRGQLLTSANPQRVRRLLRQRNGEDGGQCFEAVPRHWLLLDFDTIAPPAEVDPRDGEACARIAAALLPPAFRGVSCWWQLTSGAGIKPGIRIRLAYWLDRPLGEDELKRWLPGKPIDHSVLGAVQPVYVARPVFEGGADPVSLRSGILRGSRDEVPVPRVLEPAAVDGSETRRLGYGGWRELIGDHQGGEGFHGPTKAAIAVWVAKHGAEHPTAWLRQDIENAIRSADRSQHTRDYVEDKVRELDALIQWTVEQEAARPRKSTQAAAVAAAIDGVSLFHSPDGVAFVDIEVNGHRETHPVRSKAFKEWLSLEFFRQNGKPPGADALEQSLVLAEARARYEAPEMEVYLRVARLNGTIYLDLADERWRAVAVTRDGWRIEGRSPVRFRRSAGMLPLPEPTKGGKIDDLKPFLNVSDNDFKLAVAWQVSALGGVGPYPIIALIGGGGAAKTTTGHKLRGVFDPHVTLSRALSRSDRDLYVAANNSYALHFENISKIPGWMSDTLCRLATGGGFATRMLYENTDEVIFRGMRPIVLDGIDKFIEREDLADRTIKIAMERIKDEERRDERTIDREFDEQRPGILGALLDVVASGLNRLAATKLDKLPRMADFALWIAACERALDWGEGAFLRIYDTNQKSALRDAAESDIVADAVVKFMERKDWQRGLNKEEHYEGTANDLLRGLFLCADERTTKSSDWPKNARSLSARLRLIRRQLTTRGVEVKLPADDPEKRGHERIIQLAPIEKEPTEKEPTQRAQNPIPLDDRDCPPY
jgi:hypothetical protein